MSNWEQLTRTDRIWRDGQRRLERQRERVRELEQEGRDASRSRQLADILQASVEEMRNSRERQMTQIALMTSALRRASR